MAHLGRIRTFITIVFGRKDDKFASEIRTTDKVTIKIKAIYPNEPSMWFEKEFKTNHTAYKDKGKHLIYSDNVDNVIEAFFYGWKVSKMARFGDNLVKWESFSRAEIVKRETIQETITF